MKLAHTSFSMVLVALLIISTLAFTPRSAHALDAEVISDTSPTGIGSWIQSTLSAASDAITSVSSDSLFTKEYIYDTLAWQIGQQLIQSLTASTVNWINGRNGGGFSLFIQNIPLDILNVGDSQALAFFAEFGKNATSPFSNSILSSLRLNYLQTTSAAGFWAANQCTLSQFSRDPNAFLRGNFQKGGWSSWFALTTQPKNNPYALYYSAQAELAARIGSAAADRQADINRGQGFVSWCGTGDAGAQTDAQQEFINAGSGANQPPAAVALGPQICRKSDGSPGVVQTPGSVIHEALSKSLGTTFDRLVTSDEMNEVVNALASKLVTSVMGSNGLAGVSQAQNGGRLIDQYGSESTFNAPAFGTSGSSNGTVAGNVSNALSVALDREESQITTYETAWRTIGTAAAQAKPAVQQALACTAIRADAQNALSNTIQPAIDHAAAAQINVTNARATLARVRTQVNNATTPGAAAAAGLAVQNLLSASAPSFIANSTSSSGGGTTPPPAPTGLTKTCYSAGTQVTFSWDPTPGADSYLTRFDSTSNNDPDTCTDGWYCSDPPDQSNENYVSTSVTFTVTPGAEYHFWVHAQNSLGYSDKADSGNFTCSASDNTPPPAATSPAPTTSSSVYVGINASDATQAQIDSRILVGGAAPSSTSLTGLTGSLVDMLNQLKNNSATALSSSICRTRFGTIF